MSVKTEAALLHLMGKAIEIISRQTSYNGTTIAEMRQAVENSLKSLEQARYQDLK